MIVCPYCGKNRLSWPREDDDRVHWTDDDAGVITTAMVKCKDICCKGSDGFTVRIGFLADIDGGVTYETPEGEEIEIEED